MIARLSMIAASVALLAGCARTGPVAPAPVPVPVPVEIVASGLSEAVVELLALADRAADGPAQDHRRLGQAIAALDRYGARPAEGEADVVAGWRAALPAGAVAPMRGRVLGPAYRHGTIAAGSSVTLVQLFDGGRQARVAVATPGESPVGIAVLDGSGKAICPPNVTRRGACNWVPPFTGRHQIILSNPASETSAYYLVID